MKLKPVLPIILGLMLSLANGKDKSGAYQLGIYVTASAVEDGTTTNNISCGDATFGSTVCSGGVRVNRVTLYRIQTTEGYWSVETMRQAHDAQYRQLFNENDIHFHAEKENPLDLLKNGDKVLFRVERHKKLIGETDEIYIPFASNPNKEVKYIGTFFPARVAVQQQPPSDNVKAMCDAHKLSPELEKQLCSSFPTGPPQQSPLPDAGMRQITANSEAGRSSPAQAALVANVGHVPGAKELNDLIQDGRASRCAVVTMPSGAEIFIDGNRAGVSPMAFVLLKQGGTPRVVTLKLSGYKTVEKSFVPDGKTIPIGLALEKESTSDDLQAAPAK
jgi:hypothetical protein